MKLTPSNGEDPVKNLFQNLFVALAILIVGGLGAFAKDQIVGSSAENKESIKEIHQKIDSRFAELSSCKVEKDQYWRDLQRLEIRLAELRESQKDQNGMLHEILATLNGKPGK